jgi:hypothetical protein
MCAVNCANWEFRCESWRCLEARGGRVERREVEVWEVVVCEGWEEVWVLLFRREVGARDWRLWEDIVAVLLFGARSMLGLMLMCLDELLYLDCDRRWIQKFKGRRASV